MKKVLVILCSVLALSSTFALKAYAEGKFKPHFDIVGGFAGGDNVPRAEYADGLPDNNDHKTFFGTRAHLGFEYIQSENLSGRVTLKMGGSHWGEKIGASLNTRLDEMDSFFRMRHAYVDWTVPKTEARIRMGLQPIGVPSFTTPGSPSFAANVPGVVINTPIIDSLRVTGFWARPAAPVENIDDSSADLFGGFLDFQREAFRIAPYASYLKVGRNAQAIYGPGNLTTTGVTDALFIGNADLIQAGIGSMTRIGALTLTADVAYSLSQFSEYDEEDGSGWFGLASASYSTKFGMPKILGWYASGDSDTDEMLRGNYIAASSAFFPTAVLFKDRDMCPVEGYRSGIGGTTAVVAEWGNISFVNKLTHTARGMYLKGTNAEGNIKRIRDKGARFASAIANTAARYEYLTTGDTIMELNLNSSYQMYKNLRVSFDLGYMKSDFQERLVGDRDLDNTYRATAHFYYAL